MRIIKFNDNFYANIDNIFVLKRYVVDNEKFLQWVQDCNDTIHKIKYVDNNGVLPYISLSDGEIFSPTDNKWINKTPTPQKMQEYKEKLVEEFVVPIIGECPKDDKLIKHEVVFQNGEKIEIGEDVFELIKKELDKEVVNG